MPQLHRQLVIEEHLLLVCPHCWTPEQIAKEYPELAKYPISRRLCNAHFQVLLTTALEFPFHEPDPPELEELKEIPKTDKKARRASSGTPPPTDSAANQIKNT